MTSAEQERAAVVAQVDIDAAHAFFRDKRTGLSTKFNLGHDPSPLLDALASHRVTASESTAREIETRFWSIVDADGLSGHPSDMWAALESICRAARNRDMWKGQCERQADQLRELKERLEHHGGEG